ncbi:MAG: histidine kinase, partial [Muribaculaceae bacterium]|nr:histidine kinase [Muribaculaceae bacterium]
MSEECVAAKVVTESAPGNGRGDLAATALVVLTAFTLFYLPSVLTIFSQVPQPHELIIIGVVMATAYTAVLCLNYFWLVPRVLFRDERKAAYFIINTALILIICLSVPAWFETHGGIPHPPRHGQRIESSGQHFIGYLRFVLRDGIMMVLSATLAYAMRLTRERDLIRRRRLELDAERRRLELRSLRAQLNPHFLFNSLNNIYALIA